MTITAKVLSSARTGARKTAIMYNASLSFDQLMRYLRKLDDLGLLTYDNESRLYALTPRGLLYLKNFTEQQGLSEALSVKEATLREIFH